MTHGGGTLCHGGVSVTHGGVTLRHEGVSVSHGRGLRRLFLFQQAVFFGEAGQFHTAVQVQLAHQIAAMPFDGAHTQA